METPPSSPILSVFEAHGGGVISLNEAVYSSLPRFPWGGAVGSENFNRRTCSAKKGRLLKKAAWTVVWGEGCYPPRCLETRPR